MKQMIIALLVLSVSCAESRRWWESYPNEISNVTLEDGKPIQITENYTELQITATGNTLYADSLLKLTSVIDLRLYAPITRIEPGAVCVSQTLRKFELVVRPDPKESRHFTTGILKNCGYLERLNLFLSGSENSEPLPTNIFDDAPNLKRLGLAEVNLSHLTRDYFKNVKSLTFLSLRNCFIEIIDSDTFQDLTELEVVEIYFNEKLTHVPRDLFKSTKKLKTLLLYSNNITELTWDEFDGLTSLEELQIGRNRITSFNAEKIARFLPNLKSLTFELNPMDCNKREEFANELRSKLNHSIAIEHKFDPGFFDSCEDNS